MKRTTILYKILRPLIVLVMKLFNVKYIDRENICDGGVILAGTHTSIFDCLVLIASTKRHVHFLAKKELFTGIKGILFKNLGLIPVDREIKNKGVIEAAIKYVEAGEIVCVFPEGTTQKGRGLLPFKIGAVKIAHDTKMPLVPFVIKGKYRLFSKNLCIKFSESIEVINDDLDQENLRLRSIIIGLLEE